MLVYDEKDNVQSLDKCNNEHNSIQYKACYYYVLRKVHKTQMGMYVWVMELINRD